LRPFWPLTHWLPQGIEGMREAHVPPCSNRTIEPAVRRKAKSQENVRKVREVHHDLLKERNRALRFGGNESHDSTR
jgi:hypothetical protein